MEYLPVHNIRRVVEATVLFGGSGRVLADQVCAALTEAHGIGLVLATSTSKYFCAYRVAYRRHQAARLRPRQTNDGHEYDPSTLTMVLQPITGSPRLVRLKQSSGEDA